jgi:hypothetical protein
MPMSKPVSLVTIDSQQRSCISAEARFSFVRSPATATLTLPTSVIDLDHDMPVVWTLDGEVRFTGVVRDFDKDLESIATIYANSPDTRLDEYQNSENPGLWGGLMVRDLVGTTSAYGSQIIMAVLDLVGVPYNPANIGDNGVLLNTFDLDAFMWSADVDQGGLGYMQGAGETARDYINKICRIMAVADVGFYRFFTTTGGDPYCFLIGGRPRGTEDFLFTEGVDFLRGKATRRYPAANAVLVTGANFGDGGPDGSGGAEYYRLVNENPFMPPDRPFTFTFGSPLIERSTESDPGGGMACETIASAIMPDVNRQTVYMPVTLYTSAKLGPGQTIKAQGTPGGRPGYMGVGAGDPLWLEDLTVRFDGEGVTQEAICIGGGITDEVSGPPPV